MSFFSWLWSRKAKPFIHLTTEPSLTIDKEDMHRALIYRLRNPNVSHQDLQIACREFFQVDLITTQWKFRNGGKGDLLYFEIDQVNPVFSGGKVLDDILFYFKDASLSTSLRIEISVRDIPELLVPLFAPSVEEVCGKAR